MDKARPGYNFIEYVARPDYGYSEHILSRGRNMTLKNVLFIVLTCAFSFCGGSGGTDTTEGGFPDVAGTYDQTDITTICDGLFDTVIEVVQNNDNIILQATTEGFSDASGTIDEDGNFTADGQFGDGTDFTCIGTIIDGIAQTTCSGSGVDCDVTYEER